MARNGGSGARLTAALRTLQLCDLGLALRRARPSSDDAGMKTSCATDKAHASAAHALAAHASAVHARCVDSTRVGRVGSATQAPSDGTAVDADIARAALTRSPRHAAVEVRAAAPRGRSGAAPASRPHDLSHGHTLRLALSSRAVSGARLHDELHALARVSPRVLPCDECRAVSSAASLIRLLAFRDHDALWRGVPRALVRTPSLQLL
eukprot:4958342-Pleurochrysis_carterae.AAC.1